MTDITRPVMRYHGGKFRLAPWIVGAMPPHDSYVELFGGGASVLLRKPRVAVEVYNDLDAEVVGLFRVLRDQEQAAELARLCALTPYARLEQEAAYEPAGDPVERARRLVVRSFFGVSSNAGTRRIRNGFRRMRMGRATPAQDWSTWPESVATVTERLRGVVIESRPALDLIAPYDATNVLFYADPPYPRSTRTCTHQSYRHEMTDHDHRELAQVLRGAEGMVLVSGYRCQLYDELYTGWTRLERSARTDRATARVECLWCNFPPAQRSLLDEEAV